jgi:hypothetical protein
MIHYSKINLITAKKDARGVPVPFSFKAVTLSGDIITGENCIATSSHANRSHNIKWPESGEIRKIRNISFIELNGTEVTL